MLSSMSTKTSDKSKGGRPRKSPDERKSHRVQVAMSDAELEAARELARLRETSVSAAVAWSVGIALQNVKYQNFLQRLVDELTHGAKRMSVARTTYTREEMQRIMNSPPKVLSHSVTIPFQGSREAYKGLKNVDLVRIYDDAVLAYAKTVSDSYLKTDRLDEPVPYPSADSLVMFGFDGEEDLYFYGWPL